MVQLVLVSLIFHGGCHLISQAAGNRQSGSLVQGNLIFTFIFKVFFFSLTKKNL
jgi:hypothetical protein